MNREPLDELKKEANRGWVQEQVAWKEERNCPSSQGSC